MNTILNHPTPTILPTERKHESAPSPLRGGGFALLPFKQAYCGGGVTPNSIHIFRQRKIWIPFKRLFKLRRMCEKALQVRCLRPARQWKDDTFHSLRRRSRTPPSPLAFSQFAPDRTPFVTKPPARSAGARPLRGRAASLRDAGFAPRKPASPHKSSKKQPSRTASYHLSF